MSRQLNIFQEQTKEDYQAYYDKFYKGCKEMWKEKLKKESVVDEDISILLPCSSFLMPKTQ